MHLFPPVSSAWLVAAAPAGGGAELGRGVELMAVGMGVVFVSLVALLSLILLMERFATTGPPSGATLDAGNSEATAGGPETDGELTPEMAAVITAAVSAMLRESGHDRLPPEIISIIAASAVASGGTRFVRVTRVTPLLHGSADPWALSGRRNIMSSHGAGHARRYG